MYNSKSLFILAHQLYELLKNQLKTDKGKYTSPAPIELQIAENNNVEQLCVVGTGISQPIALLVLSQKEKQKDPKALELELLDIIKR